MSAELLSTLQGAADLGGDPRNQTAAPAPFANQLPPIPDTLSILPVRGLVVFPGAVIPFERPPAWFR